MEVSWTTLYKYSDLVDSYPPGTRRHIRKLNDLKPAHVTKLSELISKVIQLQVSLMQTSAKRIKNNKKKIT